MEGFFENSRRHPEKGDTRYHLAKQDFQVGGTNVSEIKAYVFPQRITRENFTPFLMGSFARSRGLQPCLWVQFAWLEKHTGFDFEETFGNFTLAYGAKAFSQKEKEMFFGSFDKVVNHKITDSRLSIGVYSGLMTNLMATTSLEPANPIAYRALFPEEMLTNPDPKIFLEKLRTIVHKSKHETTNL